MARASVGIVCAAVCLLIADISWAQQGWTPGARWGGSYNTSNPSSGMNAQGSGVMAFGTPAPGDVFATVFAVRRPAPNALWTSPERVSAGSTLVLQPQAAMLDSGTAVVVWQQDEGGAFRVRLAEYPSGATAWTTPLDLSAVGTSATDPRLVVCGDVTTVVWLEGGLVQSRRRRGANAFEPVVTLDSAGGAVAPVAIAASAACEVTAVWRRQVSTSAAIMAAARSDTGAWGAPTPVSAPGEDPFAPALSLGASSTATVAWRSPVAGRDVVRAAHRAAGAWSAADTLAVTSGRVTGLALATDPARTVTAIWGVASLTAQPNVIAFTTRSVASTWSPPAPVEVMSNNTNIPGAMAAVADRTGAVMLAYGFALNFDLPRLVVTRFDPLARQWRETLNDSGGEPVLTPTPNDGLHLAWRDYPMGGAPASVATADFDAAPRAPTIARTAPADGVVAVTVTPPPSDADLEPLRYDYSLDGGITWTPRMPASPATTFTIAGLTNGTTYSLAVRAVNRAGTGPASAVVPVVPIAVPLAPSNFHVAARTGGAITLAWRDDGTTPNDSFVIEGGVAPGQTLAALSVGASSRTLTLSVGPGRYYVRVHAVRGGVRSAASNELEFSQGLPVVPSAPRHLLGLTAGNSLALSWTPGLDGGPVVAYALDVVGTLAGSVPLGPGETFSVSGVPSGFYRATVRALNAAGSSAPSNPVDVFIPGTCAAPSPPEYLRATATGRTLRVEWAPPSGGAAVSRYDLLVQGSVVGTFPVATREIAAVVSGSFTFRVVAVNACGASAATSPVSIVVP